MIHDIFVFDHYLYARWLSIHIDDLLRLKERCPSIWEEFTKGHFVTQKTSNRFSCLAHDHIHEQFNAVMKGDGGIVGITENEAALHRWMTSGPEIARLIKEYQSRYQKDSKQTESVHHEQTTSIQKRFAKDVLKLVEVMGAMGNPFKGNNNNQLVTLDTKVIMDDKATIELRNLDNLGKTQYENFVTKRLHGDKTIYDPIAKNNIQLFKVPVKATSKQKTKLSTMKHDVSLFSQMYISCQIRKGDLDNFFKHENMPWPPALAEQNRMRRTDKSDLVECLEHLDKTNRSNNNQQSAAMNPSEALIIDGSALVHILDPKNAARKPSTFKEYATHVFLPHIENQLAEVTCRLDVVWDVYYPDSLKCQTREERGNTASKYLVEGNTLLPPNWSVFLQVDSNKSQLFEFLGKELKNVQVTDGKYVIATIGSSSIIIPDGDPEPSLRCTHEEADTRLILHACHAYEVDGLRAITIRANDTDVVILAAAFMKMMEGCKVWIRYGSGGNIRNIPVHTIATELGGMSEGLLFFHAFTGCDTVSSFHGIGKKTAWNIWQKHPEFNTVFEHLSYCPNDVSTHDLTLLERFTTLLYNRSSQLSSVNTARLQLFSQKNRQIENIPPTQSSLLQHAKRAAYQSGHIWGQASTWNPSIPSPKDWGWLQQDDRWIPHWTALPEAAKACRELIKCGCKSANPCRGNCKCRKSNLQCTALCSCGGLCKP